MNTFSRLQVIALVLGVSILFYGVWRSQETAEAMVIAEYPAAAHFTFLGDYVAPFSLGRFLLYEVQAPTAAAPTYGYIPVKRNFWGRWRVGAGGHCSSASATQVSNVVDFHAHYLSWMYGYQEPASYAIVCGRVHGTQAHTAAVHWEDGTVSKSLVKQDWFVLVKPERQAACQLQLLDNTESVIQTIDLTPLDFPSTDATTPLPRCAKRTSN